MKPWHHFCLSVCLMNPLHLVVMVGQIAQSILPGMAYMESSIWVATKLSVQVYICNMYYTTFRYKCCNRAITWNPAYINIMEHKGHWIFWITTLNPITDQHKQIVKYMSHQLTIIMMCGMFQKVHVQIYVTWFWKTDQDVTFGITRNTDFKYSSPCISLVLDILYNWNSHLASIFNYFC